MAVKPQPFYSNWLYKRDMAKDNQPTTDAPSEHKPQTETVHKVSTKSDNMPKYIAGGIGAVILLILVFFAGSAAQAHHNRQIIGPKEFMGGFRTGGSRPFGGGFGYGGQ